MSKKLWIVVGLMAAVSVSAQHVSKVGTSAAPFLKIGVGGRILGMGEAGVTAAEDITAMYWNPAGLARIPSSQVLFNHFEWIADISFEYAGLAVVIPQLGTFGLSLTYWGSPDIERTTLTYQEGTGEMVSAYSMAAGLSFARSLTDRFSIGFTGKVIQETLWNCHASGFAMDVGVLFNTQFRNLKLGMSISNFGTSLQMEGRDLLVQHDIDELSEGNNSNVNAYLSTDSYKLPIFFRVGLSLDILRDVFGIQNQNLICAVDAVHPNDNREYVNAGIEYTMFRLFAFRAGYRELFLEDREGGLTAGFGIHPRFGGMGLALDYAAVDYGRLDTVHKFSLIFSF